MPHPQRHSPDAPSEPVSSGERQRILLVEDNDDGREVLVELLRLWGYEVTATGDGSRALELARDIPPEVVLLDLGLPGLDGFEVARRLRRELPAETRLIALTGYSRPQDRRRSHEAGFDLHLVKPVEPRHLCTILETADGTSRPLES